MNLSDSLELFPEIHDSHFNHFNIDVNLSVNANYGVQSHIWPLERILRILYEGCMTVIRCRIVSHYIIYLSQKRGRRLAMQNSDSLVWNLCHFITSAIEIIFLQVFISMLDTKSTFEWLICHDVLYALVYPVDTCWVSLYRQLSHSWWYTIESNRFHWLASIWWDQRHRVRSQSKRRVGRFIRRRMYVWCTRTRIYDSDEGGGRAHVCSLGTSRQK